MNHNALSQKSVNMRLTTMPLKEISGCFELHLISWQHLAHECEVKKMKLFKIRPKHHSADHLASQLARTKLNPRRVMACFGDESFLGYIKRVGVKCHASTMMSRIFSRYLIFLALRWKDARDSSHAATNW